MTGVDAATQIATPRSAVWPRLGVPVYGLAAIALGLLGLVSGDFAGVWQPVRPGIPGRTALAYLAALCFLGAGAAIQARRFARIGAVVLGSLYFVFTLLWLPRVINYPQIFGTWGGAFEQLSLAAAAMIVYASSDPRGPLNKTARLGALLFGFCAVVFGFNHFFAIPQTAAMVPQWIPPGQRFWAIATGVAHLLAGIAILSGIWAVLAARLLTLMVLLFGLLIWLPRLFAQPHQHMTWSGNAINLAIAGAAWVVADWLVRRSQSA